MGAVREDGFHPVDMIMQQLAFHDDVTVFWTPGGPRAIEIRTNRPYLPQDSRNIAWKAAELMAEEAGIQDGTIGIILKKRIPVAAGMAGGSGNAAAVLHALNAIWDMDLGLEELMALGARLGSDVPFCVMGQAKASPHMPEKVRQSELACCCARATGTGTELKPLPSVSVPIVIAKPRVHVSTAEVYQGFDRCTVTRRPDNDALEAVLAQAARGAGGLQYENFVNVLELYTLKAYPEAQALKARMEGTAAEAVLMSGSGPTIFAVFGGMEDAKAACSALREEGYEAYWTKTIV